MKKAAHLTCDMEQLSEFRKAVVLKYGQLWGYLKLEVNAAIKQRTTEINNEINKIVTEEKK